MNLQKRYDAYNKRYWFGLLPPCTVRFRAWMKTSGEWTLWSDGSQTINIDTEMRRDFAVLIALLHEMIHVYCEFMGHADHLQHGRRFEEEKRRLIEEGAFDDLI